MTTDSSIINILLFLIITFTFLRYIVKSFVIDYYDNKPIIWIPERDRIIITVGIVSIVISLIFLKPDERIIVYLSINLIKITSLMFLILSIINKSKYFTPIEAPEEDKSKNIKTEQNIPIKKEVDVSQDSTAITQTFKLSFKNEEEVKRISEEYIINDMLDNEVLDVINMIQETPTKAKLNWIDDNTRSRQISFVSLFNFLVEISITDSSFAPSVHRVLSNNI